MGMSYVYTLCFKMYAEAKISKLDSVDKFVYLGMLHVGHAGTAVNTGD